MKPTNKGRRYGSLGISKIAIFIILGIVVGIIVVLSKFGPIYTTVWSLQDFMEDKLSDYSDLNDEGIWRMMKQFVDSRQIPLNPEEQCTLKAEVGKAGDMTCNFDWPMDFPPFTKEGEPYLHHIEVKAHISFIPSK